MKLAFLYQPVKDLPAAVAFYRDVLGLDESWREGETTAAFRLPGTEVELMLDLPPDDGPQWQTGGFYQVDSVDAFIAEHPDITWAGEPMDIPGGRSASFFDPSGNVIHLLDETGARKS